MDEGGKSSASTSNDEQELGDIKILLWGEVVKADVFKRWSQGMYLYFWYAFKNDANNYFIVISFKGFEFSDAEPSALLQKQGGPCAVIAPVQAFLLKILLMETPGYNISDVSIFFLSIYSFFLF